MKIQTILITGGASGIGRFLVQNLLDKNINMVVWDKNLQELKRMCEKNPELHAFGCDLTRPEEVQKAAADLRNTKIQPDVLVNNAGLIHSEPLVNLLNKDNPMHSWSNWSDVVSSNLNATFLVSREIVTQWIATRVKGCIINISSISAQGNAGQSAYSAAKAGVNALTRTWSKELGPWGIRCNSIAPGFFDSDSTHASLSESKLTQLVRQVPLGRLGKLEEILSTIDYIVENQYLNGAVIELDGGLTL